MPFNDELVRRIARLLSERTDVEEKRMIGGLAFMVGGQMCCGVTGENLLVRVGPEGKEAALAEPHVGTMEFSGRPMKGYVQVEPEGVATDAELGRWIDRGLAFVATLPAKKPGATPRK